MAKLPGFPLLITCLAGIFQAQAQRIDITGFGAQAGSLKPNTIAIQRAINACARQRGGTVYVPAGVFLTGTLHLASNVDLYLETGAVLRGSPKLDDYETYTLPGFGLNHYGIFYTHDVDNVSISGHGTIDGNNGVYFDYHHAKKIDQASSQYTRQGANYRRVDSGVADGPVVPKDRPHQMLIFSRCRHVSVSGVSLINSPFWTLHFADCDNVNVSNIRLHSGMLTPNGDGIDLTSCSNVIVTGCDIRTGDDAIVITGFAHHFEVPGYAGLSHPSENFIVSNCNLQSASCAVRVGFLDQNSVKNIHVSHINITNSTRGIGIFLRDKGSLENISFDDMTIETKLRTGDWWGNGEPIHISAVKGQDTAALGLIKNVEFRNIRCISENGILLYGSDQSRLKNIRMENVQLNIVHSKLNGVAGGNIDLRGCLDPHEGLFASDIPAIYARYIDGLTIQGLNVQWDSTVTEPYFTNAIRADNYSGLSIARFEGRPAPANPGLPAILTEHGDSAIIRGPRKP